MNSINFIDWLEGFLDGKNQLTNTDIRTILNKVGKVDRSGIDPHGPLYAPPITPPPTMPLEWQSPTCFDVSSKLCFKACDPSVRASGGCSCINNMNVVSETVSKNNE